MRLSRIFPARHRRAKKNPGLSLQWPEVLDLQTNVIFSPLIKELGTVNEVKTYFFPGLRYPDFKIPAFSLISGTAIGNPYRAILSIFVIPVDY